MTGRFQFLNSLGTRLAMLLSLAILPIGLISLMQTLNLSREAERSSELALIGRTAAAASGERALILSALGAAQALGPAVLREMDDPAACSAMMRSFAEQSATYRFAGFIPVNGIVTCGSMGGTTPFDVSSSPVFHDFMTRPRPMVAASDRAMISHEPVVIVAQPLYRDGTLLGYVGLSISKDLLRATHDPSMSVGARIVTFNIAGQVLVSDDDTDTAAILPAGVDLKELSQRANSTFRARTSNGERRVFSVVPVSNGLVFAIGSWTSDQSGVGNFKLSRLTGVLFPLALWAVSLAVAYFAVYRLVLRHVRELRSQMRRFAIGSRKISPAVINDAPAEIAEVSRTFRDMARILIRDNAAMEEAVQEKTVLLKEVHHRVKNNLQLIASIINMQSRVIHDSDAKRVLRSVQDRVLSLATIYRNLYQAEHLDTVEADRLISDIIAQMSGAAIAPGTAIKVETEFDKLTLVPDQAVPLTLLTTEAFTNAVKYAGAPTSGGPAWVRVTLEKVGPGRASLMVQNSLGGAVPDTDSTGLGSQLIEAFALQLDAEPEISSTDDSFTLQMEFAVVEPVVTRPHQNPERPVVLTSAAREGSRH
ncbi:MAG: histidine kinase [Paracoccus denitrificans]|nr:MAG: histidine kinase [Paracoccus denitrificans]PZO85611.1 MAG: histidine kinase [Paracoccus denitrificans]